MLFHVIEITYLYQKQGSNFIFHQIPEKLVEYFKHASHFSWKITYIPQPSVYSPLVKVRQQRLYDSSESLPHNTLKFTKIIQYFNIMWKRFYFTKYEGLVVCLYTFKLLPAPSTAWAYFTSEFCTCGY